MRDLSFLAAAMAIQGKGITILASVLGRMISYMS